MSQAAQPQNSANMLAGIDFSQYQTWQKITAPTGAVYYVVPGTGYVYDPFLSAAKGKPVLWTNPTPAVDEKNRAEKERQDIIDQQKKAASPMGQILPVAGVVGGTVGAKYAIDALGPATATEKLAEAKAAAELAEVTKATSGVTATSAGTAAPATTAGAFTQAAGGGAAPFEVGSAANGGTMMSNGSVVGGTTPGFFDTGGLLGEGSMSLGQYVPGAVGLFGAYDVLSNQKHGASGALEGAASGAGIGFTLGGPVGAGIGAGVGGLVGYFGNFGDKDAYKTEWKRKKKLFDQGIITEAQLGPEPQSGRSRDELVAEAEATGGNVDFARTRDESFLKAGDIAGYASILEEAHKRNMDPVVLAQKALDAKAIREHHGTVDLDIGKLDSYSGPPAPEINPGPMPTTQPAITQGMQAPAQPMQTNGSTAGISPAPNLRSQTLSPGIGLNGRRLSAQEMGIELARRMNSR